MNKEFKAANKDVESILTAFPKKRPDLPDAYKKIYDKHYFNNRSSTGIIGRMAHRLESWMHIQVARDVQDAAASCATLEIGAGTLNHLKFEPASLEYDVVEPYTALYCDAQAKSKVRNFYQDICQVQGRYDRVITIATFEHLTELPQVIAKTGLLLKQGGTLRVAIPAEGAVPWKLAYSFSTGLAFYIRYRLPYEPMMRYEHVNSWKEIKILLEYFFGRVLVSYLGISPDLSLYHFYKCSGPIESRCIRFAPDWNSCEVE